MPPLLPAIDDRGRGGRALALLLAAGAAAMFWAPALERSRGWFPAPLDDVYIHFDFARSLAQGHPFEWIAGQGYSSGETAPLYAVVLALGWAVGFRGAALGLFAGLVAIASVASLVRSIGRLMQPCPRWAGWLGALLPLSIGVVDWSLFSGMEVALFCAAIGRTLEALGRARARRGLGTRERRQWILGAWGAVLVLLRPEAGLLVAVFAVAAARGAGRRSGFLALFRAAAPGALATAAVLGANLVATGDARSAGAQLKLISSNPYLSDVDRARALAENVVLLWLKLLRAELAIVPALALAWVVLALVALGSRRRAIAGAALVSAIGWTLLVSWNGNAPHHNFRYYVPALVLVAIAAALGIAAVAELRRGRIAALLAAALVAIAAPKIPGQVRHFRSATANIRDQHIEVGARLAHLPQGARVLLGDAGAIPYVSSRGAVDALGLGGFRRIPFTRAAVFGEAATVELIERLPEEERPTHLALYPNWFGAITSRFGVEVDRVTIEGNVICGGTAKVIYRADWSALERGPSPSPNLLDELDVADVIDEEAHRYAPPLPHGGWTVLDVLDDERGVKRFDGGRIIPAGARERFVVRRGSPSAVRLRLRIDGGASAIRLHAPSGAVMLDLDPPRGGAWRSATATLPSLPDGAELSLEAVAEYRDFHLWIERP